MYYVLLTSNLHSATSAENCHGITKAFQLVKVAAMQVSLFRCKSIIVKCSEW